MPVVADDVISPGQNVSAKIDALINRSSVMVVEMATPWTRAEYDIALARNRSPGLEHGGIPIIIVASPQSQVPQSAQTYFVVQREGFSDDAFERFLEELSEVLTGVAGRTKETRDLEPKRLLQAKEYRAAVIAAITQLEMTLQMRLKAELSTDPSPDRRRLTALRSMIDLALQSGLLNEQEHARIREWVSVRNRAIHEAMTVEAKTAKAIVEGVAQIHRKLGG